MRKARLVAEAETKKAKLLAEAEKARLMAEAEKAKLLAEAEKAKLLAEAEKARLLAEAEAETKNAKFIAEAEAEEADMLARLRLESANIEAEEKILASRSLVGLKIGSVSSAQSRARSRRSLIKETSNESKKVLPVSKISDDANTLNHNLFVKNEEMIKHKKTFSSSKFSNLEAAHLNFDKTNVETKPKIPVINRDCEFALTSTARAIPLCSFRDENVCSAQVPTGIDRGKIFPDKIRHSSETEHDETILYTYLERQGRNEFINLAT